MASIGRYRSNEFCPGCAFDRESTPSLCLVETHRSGTGHHIVQGKQSKALFEEDRKAPLALGTKVEQQEKRRIHRRKTQRS
jgi:hypothetical protein